MEVESTHEPANQSKHQLTTAKRQSHDFHMPRLRLRLLAAQDRLAAAGDPVHRQKGLIVVTTAFLLAGGASATCVPRVLHTPSRNTPIRGCKQIPPSTRRTSADLKSSSI
jgi:hypothetical protein